MKKIIVGLSGGVDSGVCASLLKNEGHHVEACYMQNWMAEKNDPHCRAEQDLNDAKKVADHLQIPLHIVNFSKEYWDLVFQYCLDEFVAGRTPNPDIGCNQYIKFDLFLKHAMQLGADQLATGHYATIQKNGAQFELIKSVDKNKDQTYFLYTLNQEKLLKSLFPIGQYTKPEIRAIAKKEKLPNAEKKDSTGICFIGERKFSEFLKNYVLTKPGDIKTLNGKIIGRHDGLMFYTLGQRKGLCIGGVKKTEELPWYVVSKDIENNTLIVAQGENNPALFASELLCEKVNWISGTKPDALECTAKIRYRQVDQACCITRINAKEYAVKFKEPQRAITSGQSIVFYQGEVCLGGGVIISR